MTTQQIRMVRESARMLGANPRAGSVFFETLFWLDPTLRSIFPGDQRDHERRLLSALDAFAEGPQSIASRMTGLMRRHPFRMLKDQNYLTVGRALIYTVRNLAGSACTRELESAWVAAFIVAVAAARRQAPVASAA